MTAPPSVEAALAPVRREMAGAARRRAAEQLRAAEREADAAVATARALGARRIAAARAEGRTQGERQAAATLVAARRRGDAAILAARRRAYEALRSGALERLAGLLGAPEGAGLADRLAGAVGDAAGGAPASLGPTASGWAVTADDGTRRASVELGALVDALLPPYLDALERP